MSSKAYTDKLKRQDVGIDLVGIDDRYEEVSKEKPRMMFEELGKWGPKVLNLVS